MDFLSLVLNFFLFLKNPAIVERENIYKNKVIIFLLCFIFMFFLIVIVSIGSKIIFYVVDFELTKQITEYQKNKLFKYGLWENVSYILIFGPVIEEIIFRLPLKVKKNNIAVSVTFAIMILFFGGLFSISIYSVKTYVKFIGLFFCLVTLYLTKQDFIDKLRPQFYSVYFYLFAVLFATIHIGNFEKAVPLEYLWFVPLLILPQFIMGIFFGYIRLKNGFLWGVLMHSLTNLPAVVLYLMSAF